MRVSRAQRKMQQWEAQEAATTRRRNDEMAALHADIVGPCRNACESCGVARAMPWYTGGYMGGLPISHDGTHQFCAGCMPKKFSKDTNPWEEYCG